MPTVGKKKFAYTKKVKQQQKVTRRKLAKK